MKAFEDYRQFIIKNGWNSNKWSSEAIEEYYRYYNNDTTDKWRKEINRIVSKRYRIKEKLKKWENIYFSTLTIDNKNIGKSKITFEDKIKEIFNGIEFIANEDHGEENERLHYHVLSEEYVDLSKWKYGYTLLIKCRTYEEDKIKLSKYITKLANHSLKDKERIIHGRKKKREIKQNN